MYMVKFGPTVLNFGYDFFSYFWDTLYRVVGTENLEEQLKNTLYRVIQKE